MPFPFEFEGKVGVGFLYTICGEFGVSNWTKTQSCFGNRNPIPSSASTSTLSFSLGGGGGCGGLSAGSGGGSTDTAGVATVSGDPSEKWPPHPQETSSGNNSSSSLDLFHQIPTNLDAGVDKCGLGGGGGGLEYWDTDLLEPGAASPGQDQSILRLIMGDVEDPSMGLNKLLQGPGPCVSNHDFAFNGGGGGLAGMLDQGFGFEPPPPSSCKGGGIALTDQPLNNTPMSADLRHTSSSIPSNPSFAASANSISGFPMSLPLGQLNQQSTNPQIFDCLDDKFHVLSHPQVLISQLQAQNPENLAFFLPLLHTQLDQLPPPPKRHNLGIVPNANGQSPLGSSGQPHYLPPYIQHQQRPVIAGKPKLMGEEMAIQQQAIVDQLYKAAELVQMGNPILAQEILARLNHQLSPIGKPFFRVAFYFKEALQLLMNNPMNLNSTSASPYNTLFKIGAYKSFSEISPLVQFANFTCNQALLESLEGFERIHIVDFDIGYGGQWASLMQELALRKGGAPSLRITAFASPTTHDQLELGLTRENLNHFAQEINITFEFETISLDYLSSTSSWSLPFDLADGEAVAVNLPISSFCNLLVSPSVVLRFIKQLSPRIVVTVDRNCNRTDLPFAHHTLQAFQSYLVLLESLDDTANINIDSLQKIEAFLIRPGIEKLVLGHNASPEKLQHWKTLFLSAGFSSVSFSNFTECQAEWLVKRTLARGFHVEKRQLSLVLYWQRKELIAASAWRC